MRQMLTLILRNVHQIYKSFSASEKMKYTLVCLCEINVCLKVMLFIYLCQIRTVLYADLQCFVRTCLCYVLLFEFVRILIKTSDHSGKKLIMQSP